SNKTFLTAFTQAYPRVSKRPFCKKNNFCIASATGPLRNRVKHCPTSFEQPRKAIVDRVYSSMSRGVLQTKLEKLRQGHEPLHRWPKFRLTRGMKSARSPKLLLFANFTANNPIITSTTSAQVSFAIYEDTPEDTLNNFLARSVKTLMISVAEKDTMEERGKENLPPKKVDELLRLEPSTRQNAMKLDQVHRAIRKLAIDETKVLGELDVKTLGYERNESVLGYDGDDEL
ncbi:hypothetical protein RUND412_009284, partial [Rhizina undulata]